MKKILKNDEFRLKYSVVVINPNWKKTRQSAIFLRISDTYVFIETGREFEILCH